MNRIIVIFAVALLGLSCSQTKQNPTDGYDVVILNGRVMDPETNFDGVRNVGIKDGIIVTITELEISGSKTIDATGLKVVPGFIDSHNHGAVTAHGGKLSLRGGVTTGMDLEAGAMNVEEWYAEREGKWQLNYGTTIAQEYARGIVLDTYPREKMRDMRDFGRVREEIALTGTSNYSTKIADIDELNQIFTLLDEGLMEGALGIGSLLGYASTGVTTREMFETQRVAANYGRITAVHVRYLETAPPHENAIAGAEVLNNANLLNAPLLYCHFSVDNWPLVQEMLVAARARCMNVWGEIYPYTSGSTTINADFFEPVQWKKNFGTFENKVLDPQIGKYLTEEEIVQYRKDKPGHFVVGFIRPDEWIVPWLKLEGATIAGDAMLPIDEDGRELTWDDPYELGAFHPRTAGTQGKSLRLARENEIPLMHMLKMLSYTSAKHLGDAGVKSMQERGRMQEGMVADITILDWENVTENSDYAPGKNGLPTTGIPYVLVNGTVVVENSKVLKGVNPGQEIRYTPTTEVRFKKLEDTGDWVIKAKYPH